MPEITTRNFCVDHKSIKERSRQTQLMKLPLSLPYTALLMHQASTSKLEHSSCNATSKLLVLMQPPTAAQPAVPASAGQCCRGDSQTWANTATHMQQLQQAHMGTKVESSLANEPTLYCFKDRMVH